MYTIAPEETELYLFHEGTLYHSHLVFGAHIVRIDGVDGVRFCVWAPRAQSVGVVGDFNGWDVHAHLCTRTFFGVWSVFVPGIGDGAVYKYAVQSLDGQWKMKADPFAFRAEVRPLSASIVCDLRTYAWNDAAYRKRVAETAPYDQPINMYEVHMGTWKRHADGSLYTYEELADTLLPYVAEMGYTHIELLPLAEHPYDRSWGYQATGFFAATSRYGTPQQLMAFIDRAHQLGIGVIMDWVPGHFGKDDHGLRQFDGTPTFEPEDERLSEKLQWGTLSFDFGRPEVRSFLISNALFWLDLFHMDGFRVDAVASMLYLNFGKGEERLLFNAYGGHENIDAIRFIQQLNKTVFSYFPHALMIAEDSTAWPQVTSPIDHGGLGFNYKWNMGWMNDILEYMEHDPIHRKYHHGLLTFSFAYMHAENYVLPFSHDEVVHGKKSLLDKMPGDYWQKFANLRALYAFMIAHPGKKLLFMGSEIGMFSEWKDLDQIDWHLLEYPMHASMQTYVRDLNWLYRNHPALWQKDHEKDGFSWIAGDDVEQSVLVFVRHGVEQHVVVVCNWTPVVRHGYRIGLPSGAAYDEVWNSDARAYGGSDVRNEHIVTERSSWQGKQHSAVLTLPPLATIVLAPRK
jgi:1,4-alpha-glucan branching enzyme